MSSGGVLAAVRAGRLSSRPSWPVAILGALALGLAVAPLALPDWLTFNLHLALGKSLVVLAVALLLRAGLVSFGHGLFFAAGAYAVAFAARAGINELALQLLLAVVLATVLAALLGLVLARYRGIFFSMLSLGFSMMLYALLLKSYHLTGGTDGLRVRTPTVLGADLDREAFRAVAFYVTLAAVALGFYLAHRFASAPLGYLARAVRDNEVRVEYLGVSVRWTLYWTFVLSGALAGLSGSLTAYLIGHVVPELAYWTTSGEFVFAALLGGFGHVLGPLVGSGAFEFLRTYAFKYFAYTWQLILGLTMLATILFLPDGIWSLGHVARDLVRRWMRSSKRAA